MPRATKLVVVVAALVALLIPETALPLAPFDRFEMSEATASPLGDAIAMAPTLVAVGGSDTGTGVTQVYVFAKPTGGWTDLTAADAVLGPRADTNFLGAIDAGGTTIATAASDLLTGVRTIEVYEAPVGVWVDTTTPNATLSVALPSDLGTTLATTGDEVVVVGSLDDPIGPIPGLFVYERPGAAWATTSIPDAAISNDGHDFGSYVAMDGDTIAVYATNAVTKTGAILVYERPSTGPWSDLGPQQVATISGTGTVNLKGTVAIAGDLIAAYAIDSSSGDASVLLFERPTGGWADTGIPTATLTPPGGYVAAGGLEIDGTVVVLNAISTGTTIGTVFAYERPLGGWVDTNMPDQQLDPPLGGTLDLDIAAAGGDIAAGDPSILAASVFTPAAPPDPPPGPSGSLTVTPADIVLPAVTLRLADEKVGVTASPWTVSDTTGSAAGWTLTLSATDFTNGPGGMIPVTGFTILIDQTDVTLVIGTVMPTSLVTSPTALSSGGITVLSAGPGDAQHESDFIPQFALIVPMATPDGTYSTQVLATIAAGP